MIVIATTKANHRSGRASFDGIEVTVEMSIGRIEFGSTGPGEAHESVEEAAFAMIAKHGATHGLDKAAYRIPIVGEGTLEVRTQFVPSP